MKSHSRKKWIAAIYLLVISSVDPQVVMYPIAPPPMQVGVPVPMPFPVVIRETTTTTATTTTTEKSRVGIAFPVAVPMHMPMPVPYSFPAFPAIACQLTPDKPRPKTCPPCPPCLCLPSCTPAFFSYCSPCHQKCRCRKKEDTPIPLPPRPPPPLMGTSYGVAVPVSPFIGPPPVVVVPFPPPRVRWPKSSSDETESDTDSTETDSFSSSSSYERRRRRRKKIGHSKRRPILRRTFSSMEISDNELVKPVLTYISRNGDVKLKRRLTNAEAAELMNEKHIQKINFLVGTDDDKKPRVSITTKNQKKQARVGMNRRKQVVMSTGKVQHVLGQGKKELVFRPPGGKKISNISVSFQISDR